MPSLPSPLSLASLPSPLNQWVELPPPEEQHAAAEQFVQLERPFHVEQHAFANASGITLESGFYFNMSAEGLPKNVTKQVAFNDASNMHLKGGVFCMGSASLVAKIAEIQLKREMEKDRLNFRLEMERVAFQRYEIEFKERLAQFEKEKQRAKRKNLVKNEVKDNFQFDDDDCELH